MIQLAIPRCPGSFEISYPAGNLASDLEVPRSSVISDSFMQASVNVKWHYQVAARLSPKDLILELII